MTVIDFEVTDRFQLGHWDGLLSGGLRYADYQEFGFFDAEQMDDSVGLVLGVELYRPVIGGLSIYGHARYSFQFAETGLDNGFPMEDTLFSIGETQLGVEWSRCGPAGGNWFVRGAVETQYWSGGTIGDGDSEDLGLIGGVFAVGITR